MPNMLPLDEQRRQAAARWHLKLTQPSASDPDWHAFTEWLEADEGHSAAYDDVVNADQDMLAALAANPAISGQPDRTSRWFSKPVGAAILTGTALAAVIFGILIVQPGWFSSDLTVIATDPGERRVATIAPGVNIHLNGDTELAYEDGDPSSVVLRRGEAAFVIHNDGKPSLRVSVDGLTLTDKGTVFNVVHDHAVTRIAVAQGMVEVAQAGASVTLTGGQLLVVDTALSEATPRGIDPASALGWENSRLEYVSAPIPRVAGDAARNLGVTIDPGSCAARPDFTGTIRLSGHAEQDIGLIGDLLGCEADRTSRGWVLSEG